MCNQWTLRSIRRLFLQEFTTSQTIRNLQTQYEKVIKCHKQLQKELREETVESVRLKDQYDKVVEQNKSLQQELREKTAECEKLKQVLDEIENIIKKYQCENCDAEVSECAWCDMKDILDIISRVKEGVK